MFPPGCVLRCWFFGVCPHFLGAWLCNSCKHLTCEKVSSFPNKTLHDQASLLNTIFHTALHLPCLPFLAVSPSERAVGFSTPDSLNSHSLSPCSWSLTLKHVLKGKKKIGKREKQNVPTKKQFLGWPFFLTPLNMAGDIYVWTNPSPSQSIQLPLLLHCSHTVCISLLLWKLMWQHKMQHND